MALLSSKTHSDTQVPLMYQDPLNIKIQLQWRKLFINSPKTGRFLLFRNISSHLNQHFNQELSQYIWEKAQSLQFSPVSSSAEHPFLISFPPPIWWIPPGMNPAHSLTDRLGKILLSKVAQGQSHAVSRDMEVIMCFSIRQFIMLFSYSFTPALFRASQLFLLYISNLLPDGKLNS